MTTIVEVLKTKGARIWSIAPDATVYDAIKMMADKSIGGLLVKQRSKVVGIVTERDYTRKVILKGLSSRETRVGDIMTAPVIYSRPEQTVQECMALMTDQHIRHLPILDGKKLAGMISIGDLVKATIAEQQFLIGRLEYFADLSGNVHKWVSKMAEQDSAKN